MSTTIQVKALNYQNGQTEWASSPLAGTDAGNISASLTLVQLQQNTLIVGTGSPLLVGLDSGNGRTLWQANGSQQQRTMLQIIGTV